jgi:hypothetical protein
MGETTELIHKRIRHWKTTLAGVAGIVCPIVSLFVPPEYATKVLAAGCMLSGTGLIAAADAKAKTTTIQAK